ncbi:MAG: hypothetical protein SFV15_18210 [Polyangiaceae bacterium]|nr:hypothetical protein [Polyangiaceae bacterium]
MSFYAFAWVALGLASGPSVEAREAVAQLSPRWPACVAREGRVAVRPWDLKARSEVEVACEQLALGHAVLEATPERSLALAEGLLRKKGGLPDLWAQSAILAGRALVRLGRPDSAWEYFQRAQSRGVRPTGPRALYDFARAAQFTNHQTEALVALRAASTQMAFMSPSFRQGIYLEAGAISILENKLQPALGFLELARREPGAVEYRSLVRALLSTTLELLGKPEQARTVLSEIPDIWALTEGPLDPGFEPNRGRTLTPFLDPILAKTAAAVLLSTADPNASAELFEELRSDPKAPEILRKLAELKLRGANP